MNQWEILAEEFTSNVDSGFKDAAHNQNDLLYICLLDFTYWKTTLFGENLARI